MPVFISHRTADDRHFGVTHVSITTDDAVEPHLLPGCRGQSFSNVTMGRQALASLQVGERRGLRLSPQCEAPNAPRCV